MGAFLSGPVVITGASGHVGSVLSSRLTEMPNAVRLVGRQDDLVEAMREADAVVHLAGTLQPLKGNTYEQANVETARKTMEAVAGSSVKRIGFLSYVGADPTSPNDYLRTKSEAESLVAGGDARQLSSARRSSTGPLTTPARVPPRLSLTVERRSP